MIRLASFTAGPTTVKSSRSRVPPPPSPPETDKQLDQMVAGQPVRQPRKAAEIPEPDNGFDGLRRALHELRQANRQKRVRRAQRIAAPRPRWPVATVDGMQYCTHGRGWPTPEADGHRPLPHQSHASASIRKVNALNFLTSRLPYLWSPQQSARPRSCSPGATAPFGNLPIPVTIVRNHECCLPTSA